MTRDDLNQYTDRLRSANEPTFFLDRFFKTDDWERVAGYDFRGLNLSGSAEITLDQVCDRPLAVVLGEPGSGKTTVAKAAVRLFLRRGKVPILGQGRSYNGDLRDLLAQTAPPALVAGGTADDVEVDRVLILDGLDEVPSSQLQRFIDELDATLLGDARGGTLVRGQRHGPRWPAADVDPRRTPRRVGKRPQPVMGDADAADVWPRYPGLPAVWRTTPAYCAHRTSGGYRTDPRALGAADRSAADAAGAIAVRRDMVR